MNTVRRNVAKLKEVEKPVPNDNQVLIKVRAASLNAFDVYVTGDSWLGRLIFGLRKPRDTRLGQDVAGQVEATGQKNVTQFKSGPPGVRHLSRRSGRDGVPPSEQWS